MISIQVLSIRSTLKDIRKHCHKSPFYTVAVIFFSPQFPKRYRDNSNGGHFRFNTLNGANLQIPAPKMHDERALVIFVWEFPGVVSDS